MRSGWRLGELFGDLTQDVRYGLRQLRRAPGFAALAVITLGLGVGLNTGLFSLLDAALFKPLPVSRPEQLVSVIVTFKNGWMSNVPTPLFDELRREPRSFSGVFGFWQENGLIRRNGETERRSTQHVSGDYYSTLGVRPIVGRLIDRSDDTKSSAAVAVISYRAWMHWFAGDAGALGQTISVDGSPFSIIGVTPPEFFGMDRAADPDVTVARGHDARESVNVWIVARLKPDVPLTQARAETELAWQRALKVIRPGLARWRKSERDEFLSHRTDLMPAANAGGRLTMRDQLPQLRVLAVLSMVVLLIGCANLANLLLARSVRRTAEIGTRLAIGASRGRLIRQLIAESALLSLMGSTAGILFASWGHPLLVSLVAGDDPPLGVAFTIDRRLLAFSLLVSVATMLLFGLAPALRSARVDVLQVLKRVGGTSSPSRRTVLSRALVVGQVAACVVLSVAGVLLARTLINLRSADRGFTPGNVLVMNMARGDNTYEGDRAALFYESVLSRVRSVPGVVSAGLGANVVFGNGGWSTNIWVQGRPPEENQVAANNYVSPGFFATNGMQVVLGRDFSDRDRAATPLVAIVNEAFARRFCPDRNPIGCRFGNRGPSSSGAYQIVGVVRNAKYGSLREPPYPMYYADLLQETRASSAVLHVRTRGDAVALAAQVRVQVRSVDPTVPLYDTRAMTQQIEDSLRRDRMMAVLSVFFAALALVLTCIGVFGIVANAVETRTREIGVRVALGARRADVLRLVLGHSLTLAVSGTALGVAVALAAGRAISSFLFGLSPTDPATLAGVAVVLLAVAATAAYLPARRATRLDPMVALRQE
jgi:putative ABC transport system permease protein